ncbi:MAG: hypothetical protein RLZZ522_366 [Verrucomicrobiota bacterium]
MSNTTNQDSAPQPADAPSPATKRVAKKAVAKKATKTAAKKAAVKKVAAKKAPTKADPAMMSPELPFAPAPEAKPVPAPEVAPRPARVSRAKKVAVETPAVSPEPPPAESAPRRYGRVPGGGPVVTREAAAPRPPAAPESIPFPQAVAPPPDRENLPPAPPPRDPEFRERSPKNPQNRPPHGQNQQRNGQGQPVESRSKRRRDKRKRRKMERVDPPGGHGHPHQPGRQRHDGPGPQGGGNDAEDRRPVQLAGPKIEADGLLELAPKGFGFLRIPGKNFEQARDDVFVTPETIRKYNLRLGQWIHGLYQEGPRGPQLVEISKINDMTPEEAAKLPHFDELKAINPTRRISFETTPERFTTRVVDIMAPVGRGQRGLIVSPPRSGKTTLLLHMAEAIREKYDEGAIHLMVVLVDERPEEVTEFRRALPGAEIYASSNDEQARNHTRIAEIAIERAKRLVEAGKDVFLIMDSITRLARAYNGNMNNRGRGTGSGGITIGALEVPRRLFAAARNTRGGGSLTIMATALIQTNSRADEAIYMEFKGTGNMELVLDRKIAENYIYPAVDIFKSGTRREELLLADHMLHKIHLIRRGLSGHRPAEAMERLLFFLKKFPNNPQMLLEIKG